MSRLNVHTIVSMPFQEITYIVWRAGRNEAIVIDPGLEPDAILAFLDERELHVAAILDTHGHADHIAGNAAMKERFPDAPLVIGRNETALLSDPDLNMSSPFGFSIVSPPADRLVGDTDIVDYAGICLNVHEIPGHSPGHVVFVARAEQPMLVFGGDVLFRGSVGRCDFPGGSLETLEAGIRTKLYTLTDDTIVYPGHGPVTTVGHEKKTNPFVRG
jgi:glyoxylase-like metal-dependent hydrolase (beta-lactamase superfamily II)